MSAPVGGVHSPGPGVHAEDGRPVVVLPEVEALLLQVGQLCLNRLQLGGSVGCGLGVTLLVGQVEEGLGVVDGGGQALVASHD